MPLPTLQQLAMQSLLEDEALAVSALEDLPVALFPALFRDALILRRMAVVKVMVQAWPFPRLPLGALLGREDLEMLEVILEGLEMLLEQKVRPRCKLQMIDLRIMSSNIWTLGYIEMSRACSAVALTDKPAANHHPEMTAEPPSSIVTRIVINDLSWDCVLAHLLHLAEKRKSSVQLCSSSLLIRPGSPAPIRTTLRILRGLHLESIQELVMDDFWDEEKLRDIAPYLVRMKNIRILSLSNVTMVTTNTQNEKCHKIARLLLKEKNIHQCYANLALFHSNREIYNMLRTLKHLTTLYLRSCVIKENNLKSLTQCLRTNQLKHLRLQSLFMDNFSPETLRTLLGRVAGTLETLALEHCGISDAQLSAILPILSQCSRLSLFSIYGNRISREALENLLSHTAKLSKLSLGLYPAPLESYNPPRLHLCKVSNYRFAQVRLCLLQVLRGLQPAHKVQICTYSCFCGQCEFYTLTPDGNWEFTVEYPFSMDIRLYSLCSLH